MYFFCFTGSSSSVSYLTVVEPQSSSTLPVYLQALMPTPEDSLDTTAEGEESEATDHTPSSSADDPALKDSAAKSKDTESMDVSEVGEGSMDVSTDSFENPFLKAPKHGRPQNR